MDKEMYKKGFITDSLTNEEPGKDFGKKLKGTGNPGLVKLEFSLLNLAALTQVVSGVFYMVPIELEDCIIVRFVSKQKNERAMLCCEVLVADVMLGVSDT
jgi:hypothetical protein